MGSSASVSILSSEQLIEKLITIDITFQQNK